MRCTTIKEEMLGVDVKLLLIFDAVFNEGSVSKASKTLGITQPVVSHSLERLRNAFDDKLFIRSGRSIKATERAKYIAPEIKKIISKVACITSPDNFDEAKIRRRFTLAASDFERALVLPNLAKSIMDSPSNARLSVSDLNECLVEILRNDKCNVVISSLPISSCYDIYCEKLFSDKFICVFDPAVLTAEQVKKQYFSLKHVSFKLPAQEYTFIDHILKRCCSTERDIIFESCCYGDLINLVKGTNLLLTIPSILSKDKRMGGLTFTDVPFEVPSIEFYQYWHASTHENLEFKWFRKKIKNVFQSEKA